MDKKLNSLINGKIDIEELNRTKDQFQAGMKVAFDLATEANEKDVDAEKEATTFKSKMQQ